MKNPLDMRDAVTFTGMALVAAGLAVVWWPAALIVTGAALFWLGVRR